MYTGNTLGYKEGGESSEAAYARLLKDDWSAGTTGEDVPTQGWFRKFVTKRKLNAQRLK